MSYEEICRETELPLEVVRMAVEGIGGSAAARRELRAIEREEEEREDVSREESLEMLGIIKSLAKRAENERTQLEAAKFVFGVRAGYHRSYLDINPNKGNLFVQINQAYGDAHLRAREVLSGKTPRAVNPES